MKLWKGSSRRVLKHNFHTYRHSSTFYKDSAKRGKEAAIQQMDHVVLSKAGIPKRK